MRASSCNLAVAVGKRSAGRRFESLRTHQGDLDRNNNNNIYTVNTIYPQNATQTADYHQIMVCYYGESTKRRNAGKC